MVEREGIVKIGFTYIDSLHCSLLNLTFMLTRTEPLRAFPHLESWHAFLILLLEDKKYVMLCLAPTPEQVFTNCNYDQVCHSQASPVIQSHAEACSMPKSGKYECHYQEDTSR